MAAEKVGAHVFCHRHIGFLKSSAGKWCRNQIQGGFFNEANVESTGRAYKKHDDYTAFLPSIRDMAEHPSPLPLHIADEINDLSEKLKATDQMKWARLINQARAEAGHSIMTEPIYA